MYHFTLTNKNPAFDFGFLAKSYSKFCVSFNLVCLFGGTFSDKMPGALHARQVLEALQHYGHFSTALKTIKTGRPLFTAYPPFLWHHVLQCCSCFFILLSHRRKDSFSLLTSDVKTGEKTLFLLKNRNCVELKSFAAQYSYFVQFACQA